MSDKTYVRIKDWEVIEVVTLDGSIDISDTYHSSLVFVETTDLSPKPDVRWRFTPPNNFSPPVTLELTPDQRMRLALIAGCQVVSKSTAALNGTYAAQGQGWQNMRDVVLYIASYDAFPDGLTSFAWITQDNAPVTFTDPAQLKAVARGIGDWITRWQRFVSGQVSEPPMMPVIVP